MLSAEQFLNFIAQYYTLIILVLFTAFAVAEMLIPEKATQGSVMFRWLGNFGLMLTNFIVFRLLAPILAIFSAIVANSMGFGLLNNFDLSLLPGLLLSVVILDFKQYVFHRLVHWVDLFWQAHKVHHSDSELDVSTGFRFHPIEAVLSQLMHVAVIVIFGLPVEGIVLWQLLTYHINFFTHSNIRIPAAVDRCLRWVIVTPAMHRRHHLAREPDANSNFGSLLSIWDRLFGSYLEDRPGAKRTAGESGITYGLPDYAGDDRLNYWQLMVMPFKPRGDKKATT